MREERLESMVSLLRTHRRLSAPDLAARLGVTVRTVQRDVFELSARGVPVYAEQGRTGGYSILPGYRPPASELTDAETLALFLPGGDQPADALGMASTRRAALRKLDAVLDDDRSRRAGLLRERLVIAPEGWREPVDPPECLRTLFAAVTSNRLVELDYRPRSGRRAVRRCEPLGLVLAGQTWYLLARRVATDGHRAGPGAADADDALRSYRLDRVLDVTVTATRFRRRPGEDLGSLWTRVRSSFVDEDTFPLIVRSTPEGADITRQVVARSCADVREESLDDGGVLLRARGRTLRATAGLLAGLGEFAEVLEPTELRAELARIAAHNAHTYSSH